MIGTVITRWRRGRGPHPGDAGSGGLLQHRLSLVVEACGVRPAADLEGVWEQLAELLAGSDPARLWLARSVIGAELPSSDEMDRLLRVCRLFGPRRALEEAVASVAGQDPAVRVRILHGATVCDVSSTASTDLLSGIQRVVRALAVRWAPAREVSFVAWADGGRSMSTLDAAQQQSMFGSTTAPGGDDAPRRSTAPRDVVVPWMSTVLLLELFTAEATSERLLALAKHSGSQVGVVGYDCIPMTMSSSTGPGMPAAFGSYLAVCRHVDRLAAISPAAASEFAGWKHMLSGVRESGPEIRAVGLPVAAPPPSEDALRRAARRLGMTSSPMVLVVGSHEPRKNHLAVLHAAETLWREGLQFTLVIAGAGSWRAERYRAALQTLGAAGRPVLSVAGLPDDLLWAAYRLAHCTLFPSLNEGFGLPVAESLAAGTPVITSNFGSTRDIVAPHGEPRGGLLVDPHDDDEIAAALRRMLLSPELHEQLTTETALHGAGSWDDYADAVWEFLVGGGSSVGGVGGSDTP